MQKGVAQGSHIVADPIYAPSGGYNKNLPLLTFARCFKKSPHRRAQADGFYAEHALRKPCAETQCILESSGQLPKEDSP
jgi:hypothetical protein